jgi:hypothetical protein
MWQYCAINFDHSNLYTSIAKCTRCLQIVTTIFHITVNTSMPWGFNIHDKQELNPLGLAKKYSLLPRGEFQKNSMNFNESPSLWSIAWSSYPNSIKKLLVITKEIAMLCNKERKHKFIKWQGDKIQFHWMVMQQNTSSRNGYEMNIKEWSCNDLQWTLNKKGGKKILEFFTNKACG